jgi:hypothetical protein
METKLYGERFDTDVSPFRRVCRRCQKLDAENPPLIKHSGF